MKLGDGDASRSARTQVSPPDFRRHVHCLLGVPIDMVDATSALARIRAAAARRSPCFVSTPNLNFLIACTDDAAFRDAVIQSDLSVADGMPLVWIARLLGMPIHERVAGATLFETLRADAARPLSVYFFGGPAGAAEAACRRLNEEKRGLRCAGFHYPGMGDVEAMSTAPVIAAINASGADFLVVALGARKGQAWIVHNLGRLRVPVVSHLGAVVNFVAGSVGRAPAWVQKAGLEWLWRIKEEPKLWRRYASDGLALLGLLTTRVLPHVVHLRRQRRRLANRLPSDMDRSCHEGVLMLRLHGSWGNEQLDPLRREFTAAAATDSEVWMDLGKVSHIDSAFVGLVLLLFGWQTRMGMRPNFVAVSPAARRVFRYCCAEFVLDGDSSPGAGATA